MKNTAISAKKEELIFKNESHRKFYEEWLPKCRYQDGCNGTPSVENYKKHLANGNSCVIIIL